MSFQERFKSKLSTIGKLGIVETRVVSEIMSPTRKKVHNSFITSARTIVQPIKPLLNKTPLPEIYTNKPKTVDFVPYTLNDYNVIKPKVYYQLGGLGPYNVGSKEWTIKKNLYDKRKQYSQNVNFSNILKFSEPDDEISEIRHIATKLKHNFILHKRYASAFS